MADQTELDIFIKSMQTQGILDKHFGEMMNTLESAENHFVVSLMISTFFNNADTNIEELTKLLSETVINYTKVHDSAHGLKETSTSIGGCLVAHQSDHLIEASRAEEKERCIEALGKVKEAYTILKESLRHINSELLKKRRRS